MLKGKLRRYFHKDIPDVKLGLGEKMMQTNRDRTSGMLTIIRSNHTKSMLEKFGITNFNPMSTPGVESELSLKKPGGKLLDVMHVKRYQTNTGSLMYQSQVARYFSEPLTN